MNNNLDAEIKSVPATDRPISNRPAEVVPKNYSSWIDLVKIILEASLLLVAIVSLCVGLGTMKASQLASQAAEKANIQAGKDSFAQSRPYVFVEVLPGLAGPGTYDLKITNVGRSAARDLHLEFDSWPEAPDEAVQEIRTLFETKRTLPPTSSIRTFWCTSMTHIDPEKQVPEKFHSGMPETGNIRVSYKTDDKSRDLHEDYDVSIPQLGWMPIPESGHDPEGLSEEQKQFYMLGQAIARSVGNLNR